MIGGRRPTIQQNLAVESKFVDTTNTSILNLHTPKA